MAEVNSPHNPLPTFARIYFTLFQGTWWLHIAFVLYNPLPGIGRQEKESHQQGLPVNMMFTWHMGVVAVAMMVTGAVIWWSHHCRGKLQPADHRTTRPCTQSSEEQVCQSTVMNLEDVKL
jgi:hypothetical protein